MIFQCFRHFFTHRIRVNKNLINFPKSNYATEETFHVQPFELHKLDNSPSTNVTVTKQDAIKYLTQMHTIRQMELMAASLYREAIVRGFLHLYVGQEAVAVGVHAAVREQDSVIAGYRAHGWVYLMGQSPYAVLAELAGKQTGTCRGKGGSIHIYSDKYYGGNGIVGAQIPLGVGVALSIKYKGTKGVCVAVYGDGASNQGQVFEAFNIAYLQKFPCVFICENNGFGMGTSAVRSSSNTKYFTRGDYIPGILVDGMDVLAVRQAAQFAIDYCSNGNGPIIIEAATYRYLSHSMSDPDSTYRTRDEIKAVRNSRDAIANFSAKLVSAEMLTESEIKQISKDVRKSIRDAAKKLRKDKEIPYEELACDIYAKTLDQKVRNHTIFNPLKHINKGPAINK